jgi:hypothetical protein
MDHMERTYQWLLTLPKSGQLEILAGLPKLLPIYAAAMKADPSYKRNGPKGYSRWKDNSPMLDNEPMLYGMNAIYTLERAGLLRPDEYNGIAVGVVVGDVLTHCRTLPDYWELCRTMGLEN